MMQEIKEAADYLRRQRIDAPDIGVILGTGLGNTFIESMDIEIEVPYESIPYFPEATVEFHMQNARKKLSARTRDQAIAIALSNGLIAL